MGLLPAGTVRGTGVDEAFRIAIVVENCVRGVKGGECGCCSFDDRVHVENAFADGASMAGGKRLANAIAGQNALLVSIFGCGCVEEDAEMTMPDVRANWVFGVAGPTRTPPWRAVRSIDRALCVAGKANNQSYPAGQFWRTIVAAVSTTTARDCRAC